MPSTSVVFITPVDPGSAPQRPAADL